MVYGAANLGRALLDSSDEQVRDRFLEDLRQIYPETADIVDEVLVQRWPAGLPYARPGRHLLQPALETPLGNVFLAGDYIAGFAEMEAAAKSGARAAAGVEARLDA
jgi:predicted NAD/FAD-dependent oxidoreductase